MKPKLSFGKSVEELLYEAQETLNLKPTASPTISYEEPCRTRRYSEFLGKLEFDTPIFHWYEPHDYLDPKWEYFDIVVHGHVEGKGCAASYFCHVLGWEPTGKEHPGFIRNFNLKWKEDEKEVQHNPTGVPQSDGLSGVTFF